MKKLLLTFVALACALSSCSDDDTQTSIVVPDEITLSDDMLRVGPEGTADRAVTVISSSDWRLAGHCDWVHPSTVAGRNGDAVIFVVDANDTGATREANFKFFAGSAVIPFKVISEPEYRLELRSKAEERFSTQASTLRVILDTNLSELEPVIVFENPDEELEPWIVYEGARTGFGVTTLTFSIAENTGYLLRKAAVRIAGLDKEVAVEVLQKKVEHFEIRNEASYQFDLQQSSFAVEVVTSIDYEVMPDDKCGDWLTYAIVKLSDENGLRTERIDFRLAEARASRSGTIAVYTELNSWEPEAEFKVAQKDPNAVNVEIPDENFAKWLLAEGWIDEEGEGIYIATEKGLTATELVFNPSRTRDKAESVEGITSFPELVKIDVSGNKLSSFDFSGLTKLRELVVSDNSLTSIDLSGLTTVTSLVCYDNSGVSNIDLGLNPIRQFAVFTDDADDGSIWEFEHMTIAGELLEELNIAIFDRSNVRYDQLEILDLSGCPSLKKLDCRRGSSFTTLILKEGQTISDLLKSDGTEITYR